MRYLKASCTDFGMLCGHIDISLVQDSDTREGNSWMRRKGCWSLESDFESSEDASTCITKLCVGQGGVNLGLTDKYSGETRTSLNSAQCFLSSSTLDSGLWLLDVTNADAMLMKESNLDSLILANNLHAVNFPLCYLDDNSH
jgi:hypothetical protein